MSDPELTRNWRSFEANLEDLDATWIPVCLTNEKKVARRSPTTCHPAIARSLVVGLSWREHGGLCPAAYEDRKRLRQLDDGFFAFYMRHRSDSRQRQQSAMQNRSDMKTVSFRA